MVGDCGQLSPVREILGATISFYTECSVMLLSFLGLL